MSGDEIMQNTCPKCGSTNTTIQVVNEQELKNKHHGVFWWICIGFWWIPIKWLFLTIPALIIKIFKPKKKKIKNKTITKCVCQDCGHNWNV